MATFVSREQDSVPTELTESVTAWLRATTREHHRRAEAVLDLGAHTGSVPAYHGMLRLFGQFHGAVERSLSSIAQRAPAELAAGFERRRRRYTSDLRALGELTADFPPTTRIPGLEGASRQLGAWYVLEGSALGGLVLAHHVEHRLPDAAGAVSFLRGDGPRTAARFRGFQHFLEDCADRLELPFMEIGVGAELTFGHFVSLAAALNEST